MDDFLKNARAYLEDLDLEKVLKDIDLHRLDPDALKRVDVSQGKKQLRKQLEQLNMQQREEHAASEGFLGGMLLGIVVGAILALIFAPKSGSETREMVAETATDLVHRAEDLVGQKEAGTTAEADAPTLPDEPAIERDFGEQPETTL